MALPSSSAPQQATEPSPESLTTSDTHLSSDGVAEVGKKSNDTPWSEDDDSYSYATAFTTGPNPTGCTFGSIDLYMDGDPGVAAAVALHASANNRGYKPGAKLADLRLSGPFDNDISTAEAWTGPVGLAPNTTYVVVVSETAGVQGDIYEVGATTSGGETTEEGGWSIGETLWQYNSRWGFWAVLDQRRPLRMSIVVVSNDASPAPIRSAWNESTDCPEGQTSYCEISSLTLNINEFGAFYGRIDSADDLDGITAHIPFCLDGDTFTVDVRTRRHAGGSPLYCPRLAGVYILNQYQGGMRISGVFTTTERTPRNLISPLDPSWVDTDSAVWRYVHFTLALV